MLASLVPDSTLSMYLANTVSRPPPTSRHAHGVDEVSFRTTYIQHKTKATVLWVIQALRYVHQKKKKIETDQKVHLHEGNS